MGGDRFATPSTLETVDVPGGAEMGGTEACCVFLRSNSTKSLAMKLMTSIFGAGLDFFFRFGFAGADGVVEVGVG